MTCSCKECLEGSKSEQQNSNSDCLGHSARTMRSVREASKEELLSIIGYIYGYIYGYNDYAEEGLIKDLHNDLTEEMKRYGIDIKDDFKSW